MIKLILCNLESYIMIQCFRFFTVAKLNNLLRIFEVFALISKPHALGTNYCIINTFHFKALLTILPIIYLSRSYSSQNHRIIILSEKRLSVTWQDPREVHKSKATVKSNSLRLAILRDNSISFFFKCWRVAAPIVKHYWSLFYLLCK